MSSSSNTSTSILMNNGKRVPLVGFGTFSDPFDGEATELAVHLALKVGYRHYDTSSIYNSEASVGNALKDAIEIKKTVKREDVFVTSKLWCNDHHDPVSALKTTLSKMGMEYIDMYLIHWPVKFRPSASYMIPKADDIEELDLEKTWAGMEECLKLGLCLGIGVSNFSTSKIKQLLQFALVPPAVIQVEMHPLWKQEKLRKLCREHNIHVSAYSPLGAPLSYWGSTAIVGNPVIESIALKHKVKPAQVVLNWCISKGVSVVVKSFNEGRMKENLEAMNALKLDEDDMIQIDKLEEKKMVRGDMFVNPTTGPYKTFQQLWDDECDDLGLSAQQVQFNIQMQHSDSFMSAASGLN